jgi:hypothetical protein
MQAWLLDEKIKWDDIEFINGCGIDYTLSDPALLGSSDSGWRDYDTGAVIPTPTTRVTFNVMTNRDVHILKLKFGKSVIPVTIITDKLPE